MVSFKTCCQYHSVWANSHLKLVDQQVPEPGPCALTSNQTARNTGEKNKIKKQSHNNV